MVKTEAPSVSPSRERRDREVAETRQRILDAAREMFVKAGYEATTMRAIAKRIEYTPTAIYHHFPSKDALLLELCVTNMRALAAAFQRIGRIEDPLERLRQAGRAYVRFALEHPMQYQLMFMTRRPVVPGEREMKRRDPAESAYAFLLETCSDCIASGRLRPELGDPEELAQMAWSSMHGILALHIVKAEQGSIDWRDPAETASKVCDSLVRGILRDPNV